jgi:hypothetical protein
VHAALAEPAAAQHQEIRVPVAVVVGVGQVQAAELSDESGLACPLREGPVAIVVEVAELSCRVHGGDHQVEPAVPVEVLGDRATGDVERVQLQPMGRIDEARKGLVGIEHHRRDEILRRDLTGIRAQRHVGDVEEPPGLDRDPFAGRRLFQHLEEVAYRLLGALLLLVHSVFPNGENAAVARATSHAVLRLTEAQVGYSRVVCGLQRDVRRCGVVREVEHPLRFEIVVDPGLDPAEPQLVHAQAAAEQPALLRRPVGAEPGQVRLQALDDRLAPEEGVRRGRLVRDLVQDFEHLHVAGRLHGWSQNFFDPIPPRAAAPGQRCQQDRATDDPVAGGTKSQPVVVHGSMRDTRRWANRGR